MKKKNWKISIKRWNVELMIVAILLIPICVFFAWLLQSNSYYDNDLVFVKKCLVGSCLGIMLLVVWALGQGIIISNILNEIKEMMSARYNKETNKEE